MDEIKDTLIVELTADIIQMMEDSESFSVEFDDPFREFEINSLEGAYEEGLVGLISQLCHIKNYYERFLNQEQVEKVRAMFEEDAFIPALNDEDEFGEMPFEFDEVENRVMENIALWAKNKADDDNFPLENFVQYYEEYGDEEMLIKLRSS